ncbi:MAG: type 4a pilus biogenesis protein PilO [Candidatus Krumholzibacteriia bacterium]
MDIDYKDPKFLRWAGAILLVVVVVPMYFMSASYPFTWAARKEQITQLDARHQQLARDLEKARLLVANLERVEQEYAILREQWEVAQTLLPEQNEMPNLLRKVTAAGQQSGVEFELFRPSAPVNQGFYQDNPVEVRIQGGYHQTAVFLSRLANLNRIVNVSDLKLKGIEKQDDTPYTLKTEMVLTAYTLGAAAPLGADGNRTLQANTAAAAAGSAPARTAASGAGH